jgi:hypothetical protein
MDIERINDNCTVVWVGGCRILFSYKTPVALVDRDACYRTDEKLSVTTSKHINQFITQHTHKEIVIIPHKELLSRIDAIDKVVQDSY